MCNNVIVTCVQNKITIYFNGEILDTWNVSKRYGNALAYIEKHPNGRHGKRFYSLMKMYDGLGGENFLKQNQKERKKTCNS